MHVARPFSLVSSTCFLSLALRTDYLSRLDRMGWAGLAWLAGEKGIDMGGFLCAWVCVVVWGSEYSFAICVLEAGRLSIL
jgi:hypothetical protein